MVIVPVADLVGAPIQAFKIGKTIVESYENMAICGGPATPSLGAPRIHQLLLHETVEIIADEGDEVCITIPQVFFITPDTHRPQAMYWTLKRNLISYNKLRARKIPLEYIPPCPSYKNPHQHIQNTVITLIKPFFDPVTQQTYSAGTRFMVEHETENHYAVHAFDKFTTSFKISLIPKNAAMLLSSKTPKEAIQCFVTLIKRWAHCKNGPIPYVWGGCSFTHCCAHDPFIETKKYLRSGKRITIYERPSCPQKPFTGFDCAGLITRAAQMCGIPYFFKNTYTLAHYLKSLAVDEHLHEGDLIWFAGHVMIVSDLKNNKLVEARGYTAGYGIVHEISLNKVFQNISTYHDLVHAFHTQKPLVRINKNGEIIEEVYKFKILKLESAWHYKAA